MEKDFLKNGQKRIKLIKNNKQDLSEKNAKK